MYCKSRYPPNALLQKLPHCQGWKNTKKPLATFLAPLLLHLVAQTQWFTTCNKDQFKMQCMPAKKIVHPTPRITVHRSCTNNSNRRKRLTPSSRPPIQTCRGRGGNIILLRLPVFYPPQPHSLVSARSSDYQKTEIIQYYLTPFSAIATFTLRRQSYQMSWGWFTAPRKLWERSLTLSTNTGRGAGSPLIPKADS